MGLGLGAQLESPHMGSGDAPQETASPLALLAQARIVRGAHPPTESGRGGGGIGQMGFRLGKPLRKQACEIPRPPQEKPPGTVDPAIAGDPDHPQGKHAVPTKAGAPALQVWNASCPLPFAPCNPSFSLHVQLNPHSSRGPPSLMTVFRLQSS